MSKFTGAHTVKLVDDTVTDLGTTANPLKVSVTGAGSGGTSSVDKDPFTAGTSAGTGLMGVVTPTDTGLAANKIALVALDTDRNLKVNIVAGSTGNSAASATGAAVPAAADYSGIKVGSNIQGATGVDLDTGAGTEYVQSISLRKAASGGSAELGTATDPIRTDPTNATTTAISAASLPLPSGASTGAKQDTGNTSLASIDGKMTACNTGAVVVSSGSVNLIPATSGGLSISRTLSAANTTGINAKGSAGQVYGWVITNVNAAARFVKLYNKATAPTVGSDTPVITLAIPGNATGSGMVAADFSAGLAFSLGIGYGITTAVADADTGAPAANEIIVNLFYK